MRPHAVAALTGVLLVAGCGSAPPSIDPTGIDELVVPTPEPDPADFVEVVDNPLFPLDPGTTRTYRDPATRTSYVVEVLADRTEVAGVTTTVVRTELTRRGRPRAATTRSYAQDDAGNVWVLAGERTTYDAGAPRTDHAWDAAGDDTAAGLAMPAEPRFGDGWTRVFVPGVVEELVEVVGLGETLTTPYAGYDGVVVLEESSPLDPDALARAAYARGVGLVEREVLTGPEAGTVALVSAR